MIGMKQIKRKNVNVNYNKFTKDALGAKIKKDKLVNESGLNEKIKTIGTKEEIKTLAAKASLKAEQDKIVTLQIQIISVVKVILKMMELKII